MEFCVHVSLVLLCMLSSYAIILMRKRYAVVLPCLSSWCLVSVIALWLFLVVPWVGLQGVIVVFPDHLPFILNDQCRLLSVLTFRSVWLCFFHVFTYTILLKRAS